ncbi:TRIC cation channel family protein [Desulfovibrio sp.]|uniref:TRIC cation channel family protein n=1 Tax=Desulfovibrio sp. TaxID=885 RepID=UPI0023D709C8|nr:TRIC cation channel family protein [Desulfovibrio sp.]MDE7242300.1 TRIC cation channel family protein [Desulfovibrio sp.]
MTAATALLVELLDAACAVLLAAAAAWRARGFGAHFTGAVVLGCVCGLMAGLTRETLLHGAAGTRLVLGELPGPALAGALLGALAAAGAAALARKRTGAGGLGGRGLFFWLDSLGLFLAASLGVFCALREIGATGALALGLFSGLAPGFVRDVALGDTAALVEQSWYATAAALGAMTTILLLILPPSFGGAWPLPQDWRWLWPWASIFAGVAVALALRLWRGSREEE